MEMVAPLVISKPTPRRRRQRGQRHDERRQAKAADSKGVENANEDAECERDEDRCPNREIMRQQPGDDDAGEPDDCADRQIDPCGDDDESLAYGKDCRHRTLTQQVGDVIGCRRSWSC